MEAEEQNMVFSEKVILPIDYQAEKKDVGPATEDLFIDHINSASSVIWNGPLGKFEEAPYDHATRKIVDSITENKNAYTVVGGGESVQALEESGRAKHVSFVSTGGGAMLSFLSGDRMPALEALDRSDI